MDVREVIRIYSDTGYLESEYPEMEREEYENGVPAKELMSAFQKASPEELTDNIWSQLHNTDSYGIEKGNSDTAAALAKEYGKDWQYALQSVKNNSYAYPLIYSKDGKYTLVAGNTRLMAARVLGVVPEVLVVHI
jgi:hypothetical protein